MSQLTFMLRAMADIFQGDLLQRDSLIVRPLVIETTRASLGRKRIVDLYACSVDAAPDTIESDGMNPTFQPMREQMTDLSCRN